MELGLHHRMFPKLRQRIYDCREEFHTKWNCQLWLWRWWKSKCRTPCA